MLTNTNIKFINTKLCAADDNSDIVTILFDTSDFVTKTNVDLISETINTVLDVKKNKNVPLVKMITKKDIWQSDSESKLYYTHTNKYVDKYKVINTTFNTTKFDNGESVDSLYLIVVIPYNGSIIRFGIDAVDETVEVVAARSISTKAVKVCASDKVLYSKLCYVVLKVDRTNNAEPFTGFNINATTVSYRWSDDRTACTKIARDILFSISDEAINVINDTNGIKPEVKSTNTFDVAITNDGRIAEPAVKFNSLFKIKVDKNIKTGFERRNFNNRNRNRNKSDNDVVKNYFASTGRTNVQPEGQIRRSKRFEDAKRRYSEDNYE